MSEFTPGPWFAVKNSADCYDVLVGPSTYDQTIAGIVNNPYIDGDHEANARLIAQAPAMLEALEDFISAWDNDGASEHSEVNYATAVSRGREIIKAARGETI